MTGLPWFRVDSNIGTNDKIVVLLADRTATKATRYQALWSYIVGLGLCAGQGTDGLIRFEMLPVSHGTPQTAELLVRHHLWTPDPLGWLVPGWDKRQQSVEGTIAKRALQAAGAVKANCRRWHGKDCGCWDKASVVSLADQSKRSVK